MFFSISRTTLGTVQIALAVFVSVLLFPRADAEEPGPHFSAEMLKRLEERDRLTRECVRLRAEDKLADAIALARRALQAEHAVYAPGTEPHVDTVERLARYLMENDECGAAQKLLEGAIAARSKARGEGHWQVVHLKQSLADAGRAKAFSPELKGMLRTAGRLAARILILTGDQKLTEALELAGQLKAIRQQLWSEQHRDYALSLFNQGKLHRLAGNQTQAEALLQQALERFRRVLGKEHPYCALCLDQLGVAKHLNGDTAAGATLMVESAEIKRAAFGERSLEHLQALDLLATFYEATEAPAKQELVLRTASGLAAQLHGKQSLAYADRSKRLAVVQTTVGKLAEAAASAGAASAYYDSRPDEFREDSLTCHVVQADALRAQGKLQEAKPHYESALRLARQVYGEKSQMSAIVQNSLAIACKDLQQHEEARNHFNALLKLPRKSLTDAPDYATILINIGFTYSNEGKYREALHPFQQAVDVRRRTLGEKSAPLAFAIRLVASIHVMLGEYQKAERLSKSACDIERSLGRQRPEYVVSLQRLALTQSAQENYASAKANYAEAAEIARQVHGPLSAEYADCLRGLADVATATRDYPEAERLIRESLRIAEEAKGKESWEYADTLERLALLLSAEGAWDRCFAEMVRAVELKKRILGESSQHYLLSLHQLGNLYNSAGKFELAATTQRQVVQLVGKSLGANHPLAASAYHVLGMAEISLGNYGAAEESLKAALKIRRRHDGESSLNVANILSTLGRLYSHKRQKALADQYYQKAVAIKRALFGPGHPEYLSELVTFAMHCYGELDFDKSIALLEEAAKAYRQVPSLPDRSARCLIWLGAALRSKGDAKAAESRFDQALEALEKAGGQPPQLLAECLREYGKLKLQVADFEQAGRLLERSLEVARQNFGTGDPQYADTLDQLAELRHAQGEFDEARSLLKKSIELRKRSLGADHPSVLTSMKLLGLQHLVRGDYAAAEDLLQQVAAARRRQLGEAHVDYADALDHLSTAYRLSGNLKAAGNAAQRALAIRTRALGEQHPLVARSLAAVGGIRLDEGRYRESEPLLRKSVDRYEQLGQQRTPDYATALIDLADLYASLGDLPRAANQMRKADEASKTLHGPFAMINMLTLANLHLQLFDAIDLERSKAFFDDMLGFAHKRRHQAPLVYAVALVGAGRVRQELGDDAAADDFYRQGLETLKPVSGDRHPQFAALLLARGALHQKLHKYESADAMFQQAADIYESAVGKQNLQYAIAVAHRGGVCFARRQFTDAQLHYREALSSRRQTLASAFYALTESQQLALLRSVRENLDVYLSLPDAVKAEEAYAFVLAWKGIVFSHQRRTREAAHDPELAPLVENLRTTTDRLAACALAIPGADRLEQHRAELGKLLAKKERLVADLSARLKRTDDPPAGDDSLATLQCRLPQDAALVDFIEYTRFQPPAAGASDWPHARHLAAFVVRHSGPIVRVEVGPLEPIQAALRSWRAGFGQSEAAAAAGATLKRLVWSPVEEYVAHSKTVLVSGDGVLGKLPLAALPGKASGTFLLEEVAIANVSVPRLLPRLLAAGAQEEPAARDETAMLLIGDVDFGPTPPSRPDEQGGGPPNFHRLPGTAVEIDAIAGLFNAAFPRGKHVTLRQAAATEDGFRRHAPGSTYIHLATHGYFAPSRGASLSSQFAAGKPDGTPFESSFVSLGSTSNLPGWHPGLLSGIALAGANRRTPLERSSGGPVDDGIQTAYELAELDLQRVDLVVLSACETGLGEVAHGEGMLGMQRALQVAGARSVVCSLWKVNDAATGLLMRRFYENLWQHNRGKLAALREAQLWMLRDARKPRTDGTRAIDELDQDQPASPDGQLPPYYWAAFVLSGDWR